MSISKGIPNETKKKMKNLTETRLTEAEQLIISIQKEALSIANEPKLTADWAMNSTHKMQRLLTELAKHEQTIYLLSIYSQEDEK